MYIYICIVWLARGEKSVFHNQTLYNRPLQVRLSICFSNSSGLCNKHVGLFLLLHEVYLYSCYTWLLINKLDCANSILIDCYVFIVTDNLIVCIWTYFTEALCVIQIKHNPRIVKCFKLLVSLFRYILV